MTILLFYYIGGICSYKHVDIKHSMHSTGYGAIAIPCRAT
jgi:hypothetical protein